MEKENKKVEKKEESKKGFKFNPLILIGAAGAAIYMFANSQKTIAPTNTSDGSNTTTSGGSNTTTANNNQSTTPSNVLEGSLPSVPSSSTTTTQSSQPQASPSPSQYISTTPAYVTVNAYAHVFMQPTTSSSLATAHTPNGALNPGDTFQVIGYVNGDAVDNKNAKWWVSQWGNYVWTGDTVQQPDPNMQPLSASQIPSNGSSYPSGTGTTPQATQPSSAQSSTTPSTISVSSPGLTEPVSGTPSTTASSIYVASFPATILVNSSNGVNVRSGPGTSYPLAGSGSLPQNATFQAYAYVYGDNVNGENRWWRDNLNHYIWAGATEQKPASGLFAETFVPTATSSGTGFATTTPQTVPSSVSASTTSGAPNSGFTISAPASSTSQFPMTVHVNVAVGNVRSGPGTTYPITSQLVAGNTFTAVNAVDGQSVSGISRWWYSSLGHYVWEGDTLEKA